MIRKTLAVLALLLIATIAFAGTRTVAGGDQRDGAKAAGATASGIVDSVSGNLIQLAGGLVTIDATGAKVILTHGREGTIADITPGTLVFAVLTKTDVAPNAPLPANVITVTRLSDATLIGPVQTVDTSANTFTILGRTIHVTPDTSFGGLKRDGTPGLDDLLPNHVVQVQAENVGGNLVATSVLLLSLTPPRAGTLTGTVKAIGTDSWVIGRDKGDVTVLVNASTKIAGSPKVGDEVTVLYTVNSANAYVALSIIKLELPSEPFLKHFSGKVTAIEGQNWTVAPKSGAPIHFVVNSDTKIFPGIVVGDDVDVLARSQSDGTLVAIAITKR